MTSRGPLTLAALASAAVPGLDPDTVEGVVPSGPTDLVEVAFVSDQEHRRWVIRCPRTPASSAQIERSAALLALLARRLTMPVPAVKGWVALPEGGRAAVHSYLTGRLVNLAGIQPGSTLATGLGRAIAQLHNLDPRVYEEAGVPVYDAAAYRSRRLAELDRAAATGRVPTGLLTRWERVLDDESLWAFTSTPTHGAIDADTVLATPDDGSDPDVKAILGWESAQVADPADDLAPLLADLDPEAFDTVLEAYAHARIERPDRHLQRRARVVAEMQLVRTMMSAVAAGDDEGAEEHAMQLRRLDDRLAREEEAAPTSTPDTTEASATSTSTSTTGTTGRTSRTGTGTGGTGDTQPVPTDSVAPDATRQPSGDATSDAGDDADDAVQVEHPAEATPIAQPEHAADATTTDEAPAGGPVTDTDDAPRADHETGEITTLHDADGDADDDGDDGDDVVSPLRRSEGSGERD
ncbi:phosphotransferase [Janibacter sp. GS2]|uniref:phosphotransferase n=1 Tax=Janibacter sp. GS2 TaxID=3442646 RepID=UPI003EBA4089